MPEERDDSDETTNEADSKPTITIAEKNAGSAGLSDSKPTITIAEKNKGE